MDREKEEKGNTEMIENKTQQNAIKTHFFFTPRNRKPYLLFFSYRN